MTKMAPKTLAEIRNLVADTVVREVYIPENEYPYYFLGDEALGYADYIDNNDFDPFVILGFALDRTGVKVPEADYNEAVRDEIDAIFSAARSFTEATAKLRALNPAITFTER